VYKRQGWKSAVAVAPVGSPPETVAGCTYPAPHF
jgi:hypothetical protein